jgi:LCP family protein required for cell wall assembly
MSRKSILLIVGGILLAVLALLAINLYPQARARWTSPLGPGLGLPTLTSTSVIVQQISPTSPTLPSSDSGGLSATETLQALVTDEIALSTASTSPTPAPQPVCGGPPVMTVLALGIDGGEDYRYGLSDVIRIVRVDFLTPKVTVLSMPRDLWVEIPEIEENYGITHGKLNQAYFYGTPGMGYYKGPGAGAGLLARTLDLNFGQRVDHYGAVSMLTFVKIVDAIGGIDLYLPTDVDGRPIDENTEDMGYFTAGQKHFNGDQALRFSRIRKKYNEFTRMDNQNMVICALKEKITSPAVLPKIPQIIGAFQDSVLTDLSPAQLAQLACLVPKLKSENLLFTGLPQEILSSGRVFSPQQKNETYVLEADFNVISDYISQFMAGTWPTEPDEPSCP